MYEFIDVNEASGSMPLPSEALQINGRFIEEIIPGYRTLSVSGREGLSRELDYYETGARDGSTVKRKRYPAREIVVRYQLIAATANEFREKYNTLAGILSVADAELIFNDEMDKFFIGTPSEIGEVEPGHNSVTGEFTLFCADPFKRSVVIYEATPTVIEERGEDGGVYTGKAFVVNYGGTHETYPEFITEFHTENESDGALTGAGECGYVAFFNEREKILQFGDPEEVDGLSYGESQQILVSQTFNQSYFSNAHGSLWKTNVATDLIYDEELGGGLALKTSPLSKQYAAPSSYGSGNDKFGPSITRTIPADSTGEVGATDCLLEFDLLFAPRSGNSGLNQVGAFYALLEADDGTILAGVRVAKYAPGTATAKIDYYINGKQTAQSTFSATYTNSFFGNSTSAANRVYIKKYKKNVTFNVCGERRGYTCGDAGFDTKKVAKISFVFLRYKNYEPLSYLGLYFTKLTKYKTGVTSDAPNTFTSGDVLRADCNNASVKLNNLPMPELGAIGNNWEEFYLTPGVNQIGIGYSEWVEDSEKPTFKMQFREVFL